MQAMSFFSVGFALGREGLFVLPHSAQALQAVRSLTIPALTIPALTIPALTIPALALAFFVTAVIALVANPRDALVRLFSFFLLACTVVIAMDPLNHQGNLLSRAVEASADGLGVALFVRFCFAFPGQQADALSPAHPVWRYLRHYGMVIPVATALLSAATETAQDWVRAMARIAICLGLAFGILVGLAVLAWTFLRQSRADIRGPILVVWLGAAISFVPLLAFNVLPILIAQTNVVAFSTTQYALVALPFAVGFASIRWRKVSVLALIDRVSVYVVLGLLLLGCYAGLAVITTQLAGVETSSVSGLLTLALAIVAATTFAPLRASIQRFIDTVLYRDHYDLGQTLQHLSQSLTLLRDRDALAMSLLSDLCQTLNLHGAALVMLPGGLDPAMLRLIEPDDLYVCHDFADPAMRAAIARQLTQLDVATLAPASRQPLALDLFPECAALGLISHGSLEDVIALLALGHKRSGGSLRQEDRTLLVTVLHQCATAFENATLIGGLHTTLAQLRRSSEQLESARAEAQLLLRELVGAEERQRANLARELHDDALQDLIYVSRHSQYCANMLASLDGAGGMQSAALARLQEELEQLAQTAGASERKLRDLCSGLYPALLESLGLLAALESLAEELTASGHIQITVHWDPLVEELSSLLAADIRLHIYRIAQEALRNAARHAQAQQAALRIAMVQSPRGATNADARSVRRSLVFTISDDGAGLRFPLDYVELLRGGHLGLASMRERAEHIGAELAIAAGPGRGTRIQLVMPIPAERATGQIPDDRPYQQLDERARSLQMALAGPTPRRDTQPGEPALTSPTAPRNERARERSGIQP